MDKPKLRLEDLNIGMKVTVSDLKGIFNKYMLISGITNINLDEVGTLVWFGDVLTDEARKLISSGAECIYFDKEECTGEVIYDE